MKNHYKKSQKNLVRIILFVLFVYTGGGKITAQFCDYMAFDSLSTGIRSHGSMTLALAMKDSTEISPLYAGGHFMYAGKDTAMNIAEFDFTNSWTANGNWVALGKGVNNDVCALTMFHNKLYAGGKFDTAGGTTASHIACWDTLNRVWDSLKGMLNGNVYALCVFNNSLYVGGDFTMADGDTVNRIAVWKDSLWAAVGKGFDSGTVYALIVDNDTLYAGGSFLKSNGLLVNRVARLSGNQWDSLMGGGGTNNTVYALASNDYALYACGAFTKAGNVNANYIAMYDNAKFTGWDNLNYGINDTVRALSYGNKCLPSAPSTHSSLSFGDALIIGGNFDSAFGHLSKYIADQYDTSTALNGPVFAITTPYNSYGGGINYVGGQFNYAANQFFSPPDTVYNVAQLNDCTVCGGIPNILNRTEVKVFPNPFTNTTTISISNNPPSTIHLLEVDDLTGRDVMHCVFTGKQYILNAQDLAKGLYFIRVLDGDKNVIGVSKIVIQ